MRQTEDYVAWLHELNLTLENTKEIAQERQNWTDIIDGAMSNN